MSQKTIWGRRNPKIEGSHWEQLDLSNYKVTKPIVICLSGNATIDEKEANGFCKTAENLMGLKLSSDDSERIYEYADLIGVSYFSKNNRQGYLQDEDVEELVCNVLFPLCVDNNGNRLDINLACKNMSLVTFFSFCHGSKEAYNICKCLNEKLVNAGYSTNELDELFGAMMEISYAPNSTWTPVPQVCARSFKDPTCCLEEEDYVFDNNGITTNIKHYPYKTRTFDNLGIFVKEISPKYNEEHGVNIIRRDEQWQDVENIPNADCVSQMVGYALARSVANSINNFNSDTYIPKISMKQMLNEINDIKQSFEIDNETIL